MKREVLNKPNQLISIISKDDITTTQRKAYNIFLKHAQHKVKFENYEGNTFKISHFDLHKSSNIKNKNIDYVYKEELKNLMSTTVEIVDKDNPNYWEAFTLLSYIRRDQNYYYYELNQAILSALKNQTFFTPLNLVMINSLSSQYSIIFYELAIRYKKYKIPKMSIEEVRSLTHTEDEYNRFYDFRRRVLDTACEEISEKTDIILSYKTEKKGRRIAFIDFEIEQKEEISVELEAKVEEKKEYSTDILELFKLLPKAEQVESNKRELDRLLKGHSLRYLKADIEYTKKSQPDNFMGFLKASCKNGHYSSAELEKKERKKELAKKREKAERKRKELEERIEKKARKKALEKYEKLSEEELEQYNQEYERVAKFVPETMRPPKKDYIIGALEDQFKEEIRELAIIVDD
ncbi:Initiator Replication protein [Orenia metallireducens]|uniref:Initiator Replication protein n=1 Tax=Orenia metallireducens TaxID=1413210 RepID=A0A285I0C1_9FIRM|nr:replication initiation protein [Orenia metallireducens]SNY41399.1 Initiator Replication protein [Orenia metallireducens]